MMKRGGIYDKKPEVGILAVKHDENYIRILLSILLKMKTSEVIRRIKSIIGRILKRKY